MAGPEDLTLVVNPASGGGRGVAASERVIDALRSSGWRVEAVTSEDDEHIERIVAASPEGHVVAVLSGDGGLSRAAAGALRSGAVIAPLPAGRGDDFVRALGLPRDPVAVASLLVNARERRVDLGLVGERPFLGVASFGFDSDANGVANGTRWLRGQSVYAYGGLVALLRYRPRTYRITVDGQTATLLAATVAVGNSGRYGGGMRICPDARLDDGQLDVVVIGAVKRVEFPTILRRIFAGQHLGHPLVTQFRGRSITIECDAPTQPLVFADGDPTRPLPVTITAAPAAVRVLAA